MNFKFYLDKNFEIEYISSYTKDFLIKENPILILCSDIDDELFKFIQNKNIYLILIGEITSYNIKYLENIARIEVPHYNTHYNNNTIEIGITFDLKNTYEKIQIFCSEDKNNKYNVINQIECAIKNKIADNLNDEFDQKYMECSSSYYIGNDSPSGNYLTIICRPIVHK